MPDTNKTILTRANAAISAGDYEGFLAHCTEDTEWVFVGEQTLRGKPAVRAWMATAYQQPPQFRVEQLIAEADFVTAVGTITLPDDSGAAVEHAYCDVWRFRDGKMAELRAFVLKP
ncbi:nuclear transport factor 2 family protein [Hymenobacter jeollabukensis]|uniref:Nuclear transport factor 2 family protein n=1 Tax=Hymenobacter jeollabukensis TaxID=2025313 RepID=A0A5R8WLE0_9BACT|nr:nuclear transport factor 2 family protein [Hymenobacter jeollabukensis]TLM90031.1 nuclear transport factor 2 family protein [Hymenobacter jeollabukensis]